MYNKTNHICFYNILLLLYIIYYRFGYAGYLIQMNLDQLSFRLKKEAQTLILFYLFMKNIKAIFIQGTE